MAGFQIELPRIYRALADVRAGRVSVEHAALNARALESLLVIALRDLTEKPCSVAIVNPDLERVRFCFADWFSRIGIRWKRIYSTGSAKADTQFQSYRLGKSTLWLVGGQRIIFDDVPFTDLAALYVPTAHRVTVDVPKQLDPYLAACTKVVCAGEFADSDHWFYRYSRREGTDLVRIPSDAVCEEFPDQVERVYRKADPRYPRQMALVDEPPRFDVVPFQVFARKRLKVRTDKKSEFLSAEQIDEAKARFGPSWESGSVGTPEVSLYLTSQQRLYVALKRLAIRMGRKPHFLLLKSRRGGYTTIEQGQSYRVCATQRRARVATLADTDEKTRAIFEIAKTYHENDPEAPRLAGEAQDYIEFADTRSRFFIGTAGGIAFGRGDTLTRAHWSEVAWSVPGPKQFQKAAKLATGLTAACDFGEVVFETTPNGREWFCINYEEAKSGKNLFTPIFLPWFTDSGNRLPAAQYDADEVMDTLTDEERELMEPRAVSLGGLVTRTYQLDVAQVAFRRMKQKQHRHLFPQEYPEDDVTCFLTSGLSFFNPARIIALLRTVEEPLRQHVPGGYEIRWQQPVEGRRYVIGVDCSEGIPGCDYGVVAVLDKETGEQVAMVKGHFRPPVLAAHTVRMSADYNQALAGVERQNHGHAVLQEIVRLGHAKPHYQGGWLYYYSKPSDMWRPMEDQERRRREGWSTDDKTRPVLIEDLATGVEDGTMEVRSRSFLEECVTFRKQSNGKYAADSGAHDDEVIAWGIALQMRKERKMEGRVSVIDVVV